MIDIAIYVVGEGLRSEWEADAVPERGDVIDSIDGAMLVIGKRWTRDLKRVVLTCERMKQEPKNG